MTDFGRVTELMRGSPRSAYRATATFSTHSYRWNIELVRVGTVLTEVRHTHCKSRAAADRIMREWCRGTARSPR